MDYKERFKTIELFEEDKYQVTYLAFDKLKNTHCYLTFPRVQTTWEYSVVY